MEASTGIEPVWTDLQSAASPLRQLAIRGVWDLPKVAHKWSESEAGASPFFRMLRNPVTKN